MEIEAALNELKTIKPEQLHKTVSWDGCTYTVMRFLWMTLTHHTYHLGQIDLLMRQQRIYPYDVLSTDALGTVELIG
ncbi:DinB family protein [Acinetobacter sp. ANC 3789]|uniref:DinB family protein n=1 Tax=unclassified Acinetobacter TaxID=196816 RepID=UPI0010409E02|nr:DUF1572 domain-containing protein [Acinetobacter sp. ANC 3791]